MFKSDVLYHVLFLYIYELYDDKGNYRAFFAISAYFVLICVHNNK